MSPNIAKNFLPIGSLILSTNDFNHPGINTGTSISCYRVIRIEERGVIIEHGYQGIKIPNLGRFIRNGHQSLLEWDQLKDYSKIGSNMQDLF